MFRCGNAMSYSTEIYASLNLYGNSSTEVVAAIGNVPLTLKVFRQGAQIGRSSLLCEEDALKYCTEDIVSLDLAERLMALRAAVAPFQAQVASAKALYKLEVEVAVAVTMLGSAPAIILHPDVIGWINEMGATLSIDIIGGSESE